MINEESLTEPFNPVINDRELSLSLSLSMVVAMEEISVASLREVRFERKVSGVRCCKQRGTPLRNRFVIGLYV